MSRQVGVLVGSLTADLTEYKTKTTESYDPIKRVLWLSRRPLGYRDETRGSAPDRIKGS